MEDHVVEQGGSSPPALVLQQHDLVDGLECGGDHVEQGGGPHLAEILQLQDLVGGLVSGEHVEQDGWTQLGPPSVVLPQLHDPVGDQ